MNKSLILFLVLGIALSLATPSWMNVKDTPSDRAQKLLARMNLDQKLAMVHGYAGPYVGDIPSQTVDGTKIPTLNLEDSPQGVADGVTKVTCWPSALTIVTTWDLHAMHQFGGAIAEEERGKGANVLLGPMVNLARVPMGGRNFESFGEDPFLASKMAEQSVYGIQNKSVIATVKHWVNNNQEYNRTLTSANVDERTNFEIYYPAFKAAIDAGVGSVMCSYNRINNTYACENEETLNVDLKQRLGFKGFVMSDWGATHSTIPAANNGLEMQMPDDSFFGAKLKQAVQNGQVSQSRVDDMLLRILTPMFAMKLFDIPNNGNLSVDVQSPAHTKLARYLSSLGTVLLKNEKNILPLDESKLKTIAVLGDAGDKSPIIAGGGSGHVIPPYIISPFKGIENYVSGKNIQVKYAPTNPLTEAVALAKSSDIAIVFVGTTSSEGHDREDLKLGNGQDVLVAAIAQAQPNTIVVLNGPGAMLMPWHDKVPGILCGFMPGQESGNAIADVLFGKIIPSARLPVTFPVSESQIPVNTPAQYPGINNEAEYSEKLLMGYRWYDAKKETPLFPFGHGLSYTTFKYSNLKLSNTAISFNITNTGSIAGAEVPQLYLGFPAGANEPPKVLRGFQKVHIHPHESHEITFHLSSKDFSIWDITKHDWSVVRGSFNVFVGSSSENIRLKGVVKN